MNTLSLLFSSYAGKQEGLEGNPWGTIPPIFQRITGEEPAQRKIKENFDAREATSKGPLSKCKSERGYFRVPVLVIF